MNRRMTCKAVRLGSSACVAALAAMGMAAPAAAQTTAAPGPVQIDEIIVTGEKRDMSLQKTPVAITAIDGGRLIESNINTVNDLNGFVPGLTVAKNEGSEKIIAIRGIGYETAQRPQSQAGVAFHIDGVYIAHIAGLNQDLLDVERIEVLRGPQGTVFGQASTGGAINVITRKPELGETSGSASVSYGNYDYLKGIASFNLPVGDTLAIRASGQYFGHDGYAQATKGVNGNYDLDDANAFGSRVSILWQPSERFTALLAGQIYTSDQAPAAQKNILDPDPDPRRLSQDAGGFFDTDTQLAYLNLSYDFGGAALKSTTAYQHVSKHQAGENDRLSSDIVGVYDHIVDWWDKSHAWTQELNLSSRTGGRFEWLIGGFYLDQKSRQEVLEYAGTGVDPRLPIFTTPPTTLPAYLKFQTNAPFTNESIAGYAQGRYGVTDGLRLIAGVRYTWYKATTQPVRFFDLYGPTPPNEASDDVWTGKVGVEFDIAPANMLYATVSRGFKPGGVNSSAASIITQATYEMEKVTSYELGSKNSFLDRRLQLNVAGFFYDYKNYQYLTDDPFPNTGGVANIPVAHIWGAEFEGTALVTDSLRFDGLLTLLDGKFTESHIALDALAAAPLRAQAAALGLSPFDPATAAAYLALVGSAAQDTKGGKPSKMPGVTGTLSATWTRDLGEGRFKMRGEMQYRGKFQYRIFNDSALDTVPAYTIFNAYVEYKPLASPWTFSLSAQNLFDKDGVNSRFTDPFGSQTTSEEFINPRQVFATVALDF